MQALTPGPGTWKQHVQVSTTAVPRLSGVLAPVSHLDVGDRDVPGAVWPSRNGSIAAKMERGRPRLPDGPATRRHPATRPWGEGHRPQHRGRCRGRHGWCFYRAGHGHGRRLGGSGRGRIHGRQGRPHNPSRCGPPRRSLAGLAPDRRRPGRQYQPVRLADHRVLGDAEPPSDLSRGQPLVPQGAQPGDRVLVPLHRTHPRPDLVARP